MPEVVAAPWREHYPPSVPRDPSVPEITVPRMLDEAVARFPGLVAVSFEGTDITYAGLRSSVDHVAVVLSRLEVRAGDRVAFVLPNCPQLVAGMYAAMRIGAVAVPLNPHASAQQLHDDFEATGADLVVCLDRAWEAVAEARGGTTVRAVVVTRLWDVLSPRHRLRLVLTPGSGRRRRRVLRAKVSSLPADAGWLSDHLKVAGRFPPRTDVSPEDPAVVLFTAGTCGPPRPVTLSHRSLVAAAYQAAWWLPDARAGRETTLGLLPFFQVYGLSLGLNATLLLGGRLVLTPDVDPAAIVAALDGQNVTYLPAIPALLRWLVDRRDLRAYRTTALRSTLAAGGGLPTDVVAAYRQATGSSIAAGYGLTETSGLTHAMPLDGSAVSSPAGDLVGIPLPLTDVKVVELTASRRRVRPGTVGELLVRGPQIRDVQLDDEGYFATGDLVVADADGFTRFVCRIADVIRVGRQRIRPGVVEAPVVALPQVARAAAVQGYSSTGAAVVKLYVEPHPGAHLDTEMIRTACEGSLAPGGVPAEIVIRPSLPVTGTGEVIRRVLRDERPARGRATKDDSA